MTHWTIVRLVVERQFAFVLGERWLTVGRVSL